MRTILYAVFLYFIPLSIQNICILPRDKGDKSCDENGGMRFYYDTNTRHCQPFFYNGCNGNANRFKSASECKEKCSNVSMDDTGDEHGGIVILSVPKCSTNVRAAINDQNVPLKCSECPENHECIDDLCCPNKEAACFVDYDTGKYALTGSHHSPKYFYKKDVDNCLLFTYYGALGGPNHFDTYNECMKFCSSN